MAEDLAEASRRQKEAGWERDASKNDDDLELENRDVKVPKASSPSPSTIKLEEEEVTQSDTPDVPMRECEKKKVRRFALKEKKKRTFLNNAYSSWCSNHYITWLG